MGPIAERELLPDSVASAAGDEVASARIVAAYDDDMVRVAYLVTRRSARRTGPHRGPVAGVDRHQRGPTAAAPATSPPGDGDHSRDLAGGAEPHGARMDERARELDLINALGRPSAEDLGVVAMRYDLGLVGPSPTSPDRAPRRRREESPMVGHRSSPVALANGLTCLLATCAQTAGELPADLVNVLPPGADAGTWGPYCWPARGGRARASAFRSGRR